MSRVSWSSKSLGSRHKHEFFYKIIQTLGPLAAYPVLYMVVLAYSLRPSIFQKTRVYIERRFPGAGFLGKWLHSLRLNLTFGKILLERGIMGLAGHINFLDPLGGAQLIKDLLKQNQGLIVLSGHVGAWQMGLGWLMQMGAPVNLVQKRQRDDVDLHYFEHDAKMPRPKIIDSARPQEAMAAMASALLANEIVCIMGDRVQPDDSFVLETSFLGAPFFIPAVPYYLGARLGCPIVVSFTSRLSRSTVSGEIYSVINIPGSDMRNRELLSRYGRQYVSCLEAFIRKNPYQFFNILG